MDEMTPPRTSSATRPLARAAMAGLCAALSASCSTILNSSLMEGQVVYALGSREKFPSPLARALRPACPSLAFAAGAFRPGPAHERSLQSVAAAWEKARQPLVIAGYASPGLPPDHARALAERRALAVRQRLIELGVEPADLQTAGFGNDFPHTGPTSDVVVVYHAKD